MGKLNDVTIRGWIRSGERFEGRSDGEGLVLTWRKDTGSSFWKFRYRFAGKPRVMNLGSYSDLPLSAARQAGKELRAKGRACCVRWISSSAFVAPSTCMRPPLTESPECCQVIERKWHAAEPHKGASTTGCRAIHDGMASARRDDVGMCIGIKYRHDISSDCDALQERPAKNAGRSQISALRMTSTRPPPQR